MFSGVHAVPGEHPKKITTTFILPLLLIIISCSQVFTQYLVSLEVENPEGSGPATTVVVMTDEGGEVDNKHHRHDHNS